MLASAAAIDSVRALAARLAERSEQLLQPRRLRVVENAIVLSHVRPTGAWLQHLSERDITVNRVTLQMPPHHCKRLPWLSARHVPLQTKTISTLLRRKKFAPDGFDCSFLWARSRPVRWAWRSTSLHRRLAEQSRPGNLADW